MERLTASETWMCINTHNILVSTEEELLRIKNMLGESPDVIRNFGQELYQKLRNNRLLRPFPDEIYRRYRDCRIPIQDLDWVTFFHCAKDPEVENDRIVVDIIGILYNRGRIMAFDKDAPDQPIRFCVDTPVLAHCTVFKWFPFEKIQQLAINIMGSGDYGSVYKYCYDEETGEWVYQLDK